MIPTMAASRASKRLHGLSPPLKAPQSLLPRVARNRERDTRPGGRREELLTHLKVALLRVSDVEVDDHRGRSCCSACTGDPLDGLKEARIRRLKVEA